jgi:hypothetical protein
MLVQSFKQTQPVTDPSSRHAERAAEIAEHLPNECVKFAGVDVAHSKLPFFQWSQFSISSIGRPNSNR